MPIISPTEYLVLSQNMYHNLVVAMKYPGEVMEMICRSENYASMYIYDGRNEDRPFLYKVKDKEICAAEYMDKRYVEWKGYSLYYQELNSEIVQLFNKVYEWISRKKKDINIFEIGCGSGQLANLLFEEQYLNYTGVDFSKEAIKLAKNANENNKEKFICCDFLSVKTLIH